MFRHDRPIHQLSSGAAGAGVLDTTLAALPARHTRNGEPRVHPARPATLHTSPGTAGGLDPRTSPISFTLQDLQVSGFTPEDTVGHRPDSILGEGAWTGPVTPSAGR